MSKKKAKIKIIATGKPDILYLPLSIGKKVLRKMNARQEVEKLRDNISNKVISEDDKLKVSIKEEVGYTVSQEIIGDINEKSGCD